MGGTGGAAQSGKGRRPERRPGMNRMRNGSVAMEGMTAETGEWKRAVGTGGYIQTLEYFSKDLSISSVRENALSAIFLSMSSSRW